MLFIKTPNMSQTFKHIQSQKKKTHKNVATIQTAKKI